jgi:hypothetical protein
MSLTLGPETLKVPQTLTLSLALSATLMEKLPSVWSFLNSAADLGASAAAAPSPPALGAADLGG